MQIRKLSITNFQSIRECVEIEFGRLTFLVGPNSVGKSAIFDALDLLNCFGRGDYDSVREIVRSSSRLDINEPMRIELLAEIDNNDRQLSGYYNVDSFPLDPNTSLERHLTILAKSTLDTYLWSIFRERKIESINFTIEFNQSELEKISLSTDNEILIDYDRNASILLNPYFDQIEESSQNRNHPCIPEIRIERRWFVSINLINEEIEFVRHIQNAHSTARGRSLVQSSEEGITIYGLTCEFPKNSKSNLAVEPTWSVNKISHTELIRSLVSLLSPFETWDFPDGAFELPENINVSQWNLSGLDVDRAIRALVDGDNLFLNENNSDDWTLYSLEWLIGRHILENYNIPDDMNSSEALTKFLEVEYADSEAGESLRSIFENFADVLNGFLLQTKSIIEHGTDRRHVRGDRSRISSHTLYHMGIRHSNRAISFLAAPIRGDRKLGLKGDPVSGINSDSNIEELAQKVVHDSQQKERDRKTNPDILQTINKLTQHDMPSLSRFAFRAEVYKISRHDQCEDHHDPNELDGDFLVGFYLEDKGSNGCRRNFEEVGSGLSLVFPVLASVVLQKKLISIEQPELHLHPQAQKELLDVFARSDRQIIIESHSDTLIFAVSSLLNKNNKNKFYNSEKVSALTSAPGLSAGDVKFNHLYTQSLPETLALRSSIVRMTEDGSLLDDWPSGFDWKAISPAFEQIKVFGQNESVRNDLMKSKWIRELPKDIGNWLVQSCIAYIRQDWLAWITYASKIIENCLRLKIVAPLRRENFQQLQVMKPNFNQKELSKKFLKELKNSNYTKMTLGDLRVLIERTTEDQNNLDQVEILLRDWLKKTSWAEEWRIHYRLFIDQLKVFIPLRNMTIHNGKCINIQEIDALRSILIDLDNNPGITFLALAMVPKYLVPTKGSTPTLVIARPSEDSPRP